MTKEKVQKLKLELKSTKTQALDIYIFSLMPQDDMRDIIYKFWYRINFSTPPGDKS